MFSVVRTSEADFDVALLAGHIAEHRDMVFTDLAQQLGKSPGILFENLERKEAKSLSALLGQYGVQTEVLDASKVVKLPPVKSVEACELLPNLLRCRTSSEIYSIPWPDVCWIDLVSIGQQVVRRTRTRADLAARALSYDSDSQSGEIDGLTPSGPRAPWRETKWVPTLDIVSIQMEAILRLDLTLFNFHSTGQKVHASRQQNVWALCIGLVSAATSAICGSGVRWVREGGLPQRAERTTQDRHDNLLRWHLTRIGLQQEVATAGPLVAQDSSDDLAAKLAELVAMCELILEDGELSLDEIRELIRWLREHRNLAIPSVRSLADLMQQIIADKVVTSSERDELKGVLESMISDGC